MHDDNFDGSDGSDGSDYSDGSESKTGFNLAQDEGKAEVINLTQYKMPNIGFWLHTCLNKNFYFHIMVFI